MIKQYIDFTTNDYIVEVDGTIVFSISIKDSQNVEIRTPKDVYHGDIKEVRFVK